MGTHKRLAVLGGATPGPDADSVAEPEADELQEPADLSLVIATIAGAEYTLEAQTTKIPV